MSQAVRVEKLVHGGQGIAEQSDHKKVFLWNVLPGELVEFTAQKSKKNYLEAVATQILESSPERIEPKDEAYLSTSPWQIMTFAAENLHKQSILSETFQREHVVYNNEIQFVAPEFEWAYRNKMEYSFWGDDDGLHLALFHRASHGKRIVQGSSIAMPIIDKVARKIVAILQQNNVRASELKTVVVRCNQQGNAVAALFVKNKDFPLLPDLAGVCSGLVIYYSNPKSPASVATEELFAFGDRQLVDAIAGRALTYDVLSFFQVNVPIFERALSRMVSFVGKSEKVLDMYAGVGTIGLTMSDKPVLVESDPYNCEMARTNAQGTAAQVIESPAEKAVEHIDSQHVLIVDPPRAGLHRTVIERIRDKLPPKIIYLSCNPITQARDVAILQDLYNVELLEGYNFFPRTPHIESLAVLKRL